MPRHGCEPSSKLMPILQARSCRVSAHVIHRQRSVTFGHRRLADVIAGEILRALRSRQRGKSFARVHLARGCYRFDARRATYMRAAETYSLSNRIIKFVNRAGM